MQETQIRFLGREDPLEEEMVTCSSILAWKIPWTEEPGRLKSMGSQRVRHDLAIQQQQPTMYGICNFCILNFIEICQKIRKMGPFETFRSLVFSNMSNWSVGLSFQDVAKSSPSSKGITVIWTYSNKWKYRFLNLVGVKYWSGKYGPTGLRWCRERGPRNSDEGQEGAQPTGSCAVLSHWVVSDSLPWTVARQVPLSLGFSKQEYWSGLPCPPPGDLPKPGIEPRPPTLRADSLQSETPGKPSGVMVSHSWVSPMGC